MIMTWVAASPASTSLITASSSFASKNQPSSRHSRSGFHVLCRSRSFSAPSSSIVSDLKFSLHDALDSSGIQTSHAREAREGFCAQIQKLSEIERETSISINRYVDLGRTALYIAAEDDSLVSHSSVPLPMDAFIDRLDDLSMCYCSHYSSSFRWSPENFFESLESYLYEQKGFRRSSVEYQLEPQALYLHSVLTHRSGSTAMLSLIYSEILKMLRLWGLLDFDAEIFVPHDLHSHPRGYHKQKSKESDQAHIMTSQALLVEILRNLKDAFWPFQHDSAGSLFLRAARATNCVNRPNINEDSGSQLAFAKAAQHRLERGVWTSVRFGDMRRALAACERLILLKNDAKELRDYSILLYHCGFFEQALKYLKLYQESRSCSLQNPSPDWLSSLEDDAAEKLTVRLNLIAMEQGWSSQSFARNWLGNNSEPW